MKKSLFALCASLLVLSAWAEPAKALLVVQNHAGPQYSMSLANLSTRLAANLAGESFEVIDPNDVVGTKQNRGLEGEAMPLAAANRLAVELGANVLITASIDQMAVSSVGAPALAKRIKGTLTLQAKDATYGSAKAGVTVSATGRNYTVAEFDANSDDAYQELVDKLCRQGAAALLAKCEHIVWQPIATKILVGFACNYPGADISIDGLSRGTCPTIGAAPLKIMLLPGVHNLKITYPFALPYEVQATFDSESVFLVKLEVSDEGIRRSREDAYFKELLDRMHKAGDVDDFCRTEQAKGYAQFMSSSHIQLHGMPSVLIDADWDVNTGIIK